MDGVALGRAMIEAMRAEAGDRAACLATVVVGDNPRCHAFARDKRAAAANAGIATVAVDLAAAATQDEVQDAVGRLGADPAVHGIFLQLPLPRHLDLAGVVDLVPPRKDVDGMRPVAVHSPTTPLAVVRLLEHHGIPIRGRRAVVVSAPGAQAVLDLLLTVHGADVAVTDQPAADVCRTADILVVADGRPGAITADHVRPGATVIDLVGALDVASVRERAGAVGPYPTSVGPVAVACLLRNTLDAAR